MPIWKEESYIRQHVQQLFYKKHGTYEGYNPFTEDAIMKKLPKRTIWEACMCPECPGAETTYYDVSELDEPT